MAEPIVGLSSEVIIDPAKAKSGAEVAATAATNMARKIEDALKRIKGPDLEPRLKAIEGAVQRLGGVSALTAPQLDRLRVQLERLAKQGAEIPASLKGVVTETNRLGDAVKAAASGQGWQGILGSISPQAVATAAAIAGVTGAIALAAKTVVDSVRAWATQAEELQNLAGSYNMNVVALQRLKAAADDADVPFEMVAKGATKIANALVETPEKIEAVGLSVQELMAMQPDQQFFAVAEAIAAIQNPTLQTHAAMELLGRSGPEVLRLLKTDMRGVADEAQRLGFIMSEDQVKAAAALKNELDKQGQAWKGLEQTLAAIITDSPDLLRSIGDITELVGLLSRVALDATPALKGLGWALKELSGIGTVMRGLAAAGDLAKLMNPAQGFGANASNVGAQKWWEIQQGGPQRGPTTQQKKEADEAAAAWLKKQEEIGKKNADIAARNRDEDAKAGAEAMARAIKAQEDLSAQLLNIKIKEVAARKQISEEAAKSEIEAEGKSREWIAKREAGDAQLIAQSRAVLAAATAKDVETLTAKIDAIHAATEAAIVNVRATEKTSEAAQEEAVANLKAAAAHQVATVKATAHAKAMRELERSFGEIEQLFGELTGLLDVLGVAQDSALGKAATLGQGLAATGKSFASAGAAYASGNYLKAATEAIKGLGQLAGTLKSVFSKPEYKKVMEDVGRDWGVSISQGLAEQIAKDSKRIGDRLAATLLHLSDIIKEAGGLKSFGVEKAMTALHDLFSMVETGKLSLVEATKQFDSVFAEMADGVTKSGGLASKQFKELIALQQRFGMESKAVNDYMNAQAERGIKGLKAFLDNAKITVQGAAEVVGAGLAAAYDQLIGEGKSPAEAFKELEPYIEKFKKQLEDAGLSGGAAFAELEARAALFADEVTGPALTGMHGLTDFLVSLSNMNLLTQESFSGLVAQITATADALRVEGEIGPAALAAMAPDLQKIWELQKDYGYAVDEATQKLLDQAVQAGVVGEAHRSASDRMVDGVERVVTVLEALARHLGVIIPEQAKKGAEAIEAEFGDISIPVVDVHYKTINDGDEGGGGPPPGKAFGGFVNYPLSGAWDLLHGQEAVIPKGDRGDWFMDMLRTATAQGIASVAAAAGSGGGAAAAGGGPSGGPVHGDVYLDGEKVGRFIGQAARDNKGGLKSDIQAIAAKKI